MKKLSGNEIRKAFLEYFEKNKHNVIASSSLIPQNDPTLYFTNAGMVPFKNLFTGEEKQSYSRATSSQKCMRVSGKHNDLENVGRTERHHTFFEMLGNFSFGDYFKSQAIDLAWKFLTEELQIPKEKLWITIFEDDDEAEKIWHEEQNIPKDRIVRMGAKDNFWSMGETGPCGPCSEIHIEKDFIDNPSESTLKEFDEDKVMEIWNLVFMQFERHADGSQTDLPKPSIDTGMGLERLAAVLQNVSNNYDTDLFQPIIQSAAKITQTAYGKSEESDVSLRVIADHIRATVFLINDGVLPSNEGRGYVLRRIMRRAIRHGKLLGQTHPFFHKIAEIVIQEMGEAYPDLKNNQNTIQKVVMAEEERFFETLDKGLKILAEEVETLKGKKKKTLSGDVAFKLYDTYGFPLDLTEIILAENQISVDKDGFEKNMQEQKERARAAWKGSGQDKANPIYAELAEKFTTEFVGYQSENESQKVVALLQNSKEVNSVKEGRFEVVFEKTPFYGESGGQAGDTGIIKNENAEAKVIDTQKPSESLFVHTAEIKNGEIKLGDKLSLEINSTERRSTMRNHSATHLMHAALRKVLGDHVRQAGSLVNADGLRFDFSHFEALTDEQIQAIENEVNQAILKNFAIKHEEKTYDQAISDGALAFFGDKYGDSVRVITMGDYSVELCGGTHLNQTSEIGLFKIVSESSIAAGVRRIEAITGEKAVSAAKKESSLLQGIALKLKTPLDQIPERIDKLASRIKDLEKENESLKAKVLRGNASELLKNKLDIQGTPFILHHAKVENGKVLGELADVILENLKSGVAVVSGEIGEKLSLLVSVSPDLTSKFSANEILKPLAEAIGGRGGGKANRAQAGGNDKSGLNKFQEILEKMAS